MEHFYIWILTFILSKEAFKNIDIRSDFYENVAI